MQFCPPGAGGWQESIALLSYQVHHSHLCFCLTSPSPPSLILGLKPPFLSYKETWVLDLGSVLNPQQSHLKILNLILSAKTLFPNKMMLSHHGLGLGHVFCRDTMQP